jgi:hypothetical protein
MLTRLPRQQPEAPVGWQGPGLCSVLSGVQCGPRMHSGSRYQAAVGKLGCGVVRVGVLRLCRCGKCRGASWHNGEVFGGVQLDLVSAWGRVSPGGPVDSG